MKVRVYYNLIKKCWSVQHKGKVIFHLPEVELTNVSFKVLESGRQRVLKEKRKNVHAYVIGDFSVASKHTNTYTHPVTYNPYKSSSFVYKGTDKPVTETFKRVLCAKDKLVYPINTFP